MITFGAELEFADVLYGQRLPTGNSWNTQDYTIVNSNGVANCPIGKYYQYGGEINTKPTNTVEEQVNNFVNIISILRPKPVINYRCNLHIHAGMRGLRDDLSKLKTLLSYIDRYQQEIFDLIEPIPEPTRQEYRFAEEYAGAMRRYRRRFQSHQSVLAPSQVEKMMNATTTEEFYLAHFRVDKKGVPQKQLHQRCGINLRSLWENDETIEFRHFPGTINSHEFNSCLEWVECFMEVAFYDISPTDVMVSHPNWVFPKFKPYEHDLEVIYQLTKHSQPPAVKMENIARYA